MSCEIMSLSVVWTPRLQGHSPCTAHHAASCSCPHLEVSPCPACPHCTETAVTSASLPRPHGSCSHASQPSSPGRALSVCPVSAARGWGSCLPWTAAGHSTRIPSRGEQGDQAARGSWWGPQRCGKEGGGAGGPGGGVSEPYLNLLMFFSDTRMKSTMG